MNKLSLSALLAALALIASPSYAADVAAGKAIAEGHLRRLSWRRRQG